MNEIVNHYTITPVIIGLLIATTIMIAGIISWFFGSPTLVEPSTCDCTVIVSQHDAMMYVTSTFIGVVIGAFIVTVIYQMRGA